MPRFAQRRVIWFFWPILASSANQTSIGFPGASRAVISATQCLAFFKRDHSIRVLRVMPRPRRQSAVAHRTQIPAERLLADRDAIPLHHPLGQITQPPANHTVHRRDCTVIDQLSQFTSLRLIKSGSLARRLAVHQPGWARRIEPQHPVSEGLQAYPARASTLAP